MRRAGTMARRREQELQKLLWERRESMELQMVRELAGLRHDALKHKLLDVAPEHLLKTQGEAAAYAALLALFDRPTSTDLTSE